MRMRARTEYEKTSVNDRIFNAVTDLLNSLKKIIL